MAIAFSYISRSDFKNRIANLGATDTTDDAKIDLVLQGVSQWIDKFCDRTFRTYLATYYFTAEFPGVVELGEDLLSVTTLKHDEDGDRTYETMWATTDYDLWPFNAAAKEQPYAEIRLTPQGTKSFPATPKGIEIVGKWGYWDSRVASVTTLNGAISSTTATTFTAADGSLLEILQTILIDSEQMFITNISTNTITVKRGVNGTTAATHLTAAAIDVYEYHPAVAEACYIQANRIFSRKQAPFGVQGAADMGTMAVIPKLDPDVKQLLSPFSRLTTGVF